MPGWGRLEPQERADLRDALRGFLFFIACALVFAMAIGIEVLSASVRLGPEGIIELAQETSLLAGSVVFFWLAWRLPAGRGGLLLIAGFLGAMYIRENDLTLDALVPYGWQAVVSVFLVIVLSLVWMSGRRSVFSGIGGFVRSWAFPVMAIGLAIVLVYSRLYGSGWFWMHFGIDKTVRQMRITKNLAEECTELLGYFTVLVSSLMYLFGVLRGSGAKKS